MRRSIINKIIYVPIILNTLATMSCFASCASKDAVKNVDGSDWQGVASGIFTPDQYKIHNENNTVVYCDGTGIIANDLVIPNYVNVNGKTMVVLLGEKCFANCRYSLTGTVEFNDFITTIPYRCFYEDDQIISVKFHTYPKVFEDECFCNGYLQHIYVNNSTNWALEVKTIGNAAFAGVCLSDPIVFGPSLTSLGLQCFYYNFFLKYVDLTFAEKLTEIPIEAFCMCTALTTVKLNKNIHTIGNSAFYQDINLLDVILPIAGMSMELGDSCFGSCGLFNGFSKKCKITSVGEGCFFDDKRLEMNIWEPEYKLNMINVSACEGLNVSKIIFYQDGPQDVLDRAFATCDNLHCLDFSDFIYPNVPQWTGIDIFHGAPDKGVIFVDSSNLFNVEFEKLFYDKYTQTYRQGIILDRDHWQVKVKSNDTL